VPLFCFHPLILGISAHKNSSVWVFYPSQDSEIKHKSMLKKLGEHPIYPGISS